jgi:hypothetical protein
MPPEPVMTRRTLPDLPLRDNHIDGSGGLEPAPQGPGGMHPVQLNGVSGGEIGSAVLPIGAVYHRLRDTRVMGAMYAPSEALVPTAPT